MCAQSLVFGRFFKIHNSFLLVSFHISCKGSSRANNRGPDIKIFFLNWWAAPPETGQAVSAENNVLERNIDTKKDVQGDNPEKIMKHELCVLFQAESEDLEEDDETIVQ